MARTKARLLDHIRNLLTLRYDPMSVPARRHKTVDDWEATFWDSGAKMLEAGLLDAIVRGLDKYDTIGVALSSGIDSVLALALTRKVLPNKKIIAIHHTDIHDEYDRVKHYADKWADKLLLCESTGVIEQLDWQITLTKEPVWDAFNYPLFQAAKEYNCDVLLTGDGADELFGGYVFRYFNYDPGSGTPTSRVRGYLDTHKRDWVPDQEHMFGPEIPFKWDMIDQHFLHYFDNELGPVSQLFFADYNGKLLHNFIPRDERIAKIYGVPVFSPYLNPSIETIASHIPAAFKIVGDVGKVPLREIGSRHDVVTTTKKYGFSMDIIKEWNTTGISQRIRLAQDTNQIYSMGYINYDWAIRHIKNPADNKDPRYVSKFIQLLALEKWIERYG